MNTPRLARHFLILLAVCLVVFLGVRIYLSRPDTPVSTDEATVVPSGKDLELRDVTFTQTEDGEPVWTLKAERADYTQAAKLADFYEIEVVFFGPDRLERARLRARSGEADLTTHQVVARGAVELVTVDGAVLKSEVLNYRHVDATLWTDSPVTFERLGARIEGQGMTYSLDRKLLHLESDVSAYVPFSTQK